MAKKEKYYIAFYRFTDTKVWHRTQLDKDKERLQKYLDTIQYIDKTTINVLDVLLPE